MKYGILGIVLVFVVLFFLAKRRERKLKGSIDFIEDFIVSNPEKCSICVVQNREALMVHNSSFRIPIAGVYQIIIAIEYAERVANGNLDPKELIYFDQLDNFYVPKSDGGAHMAWFKAISRSIVEGGISLDEVVKGMLNFNSMANTEFLLNKIGLSNINKRIEKLDLKDHTDINYPVGSLLLGHVFFPNLKGEDLQNTLLSMSDSEYFEKSAYVHKKLISDPSFKTTLGEIDFDAQKVWSERLTNASAESYGELMSKLNSKDHFEKEVNIILSELLERAMQTSSSSKWLKHAGQKMASSAYNLSQVMYASDREGNTTEMAMFFNNLSIQEISKIMRAIPAFELKILSKPLEN